MNDNDVTQVLEPVQGAAEGSGDDGSSGVATAAAADAGGSPRRWIAAVVIVALLALAGLGLGIAMGKRGGGAGDDTVAVPDLRGMTLDRAGDEVLAAGFEPGTLSYAVVASSVAPSGTVLSQEPLPGALAAAGSKIDIVLAQGPQPATTTTAQPPVQEANGSAATNTGTSGGTSTPPPPEQESPLPDLPPAQTIDPSKLQPRIADPGIFKLVQTQYKTVLEHEGFGGDWQSPAITLGDKPKRIWFTADGPYAYPCAVWAWGPNDVDWKLKTIWASYPGAFEKEDGTGGTLIESFDAGSGTYTILVRVNPEVTWWKVRIEEEK